MSEFKRFVWLSVLFIIYVITLAFFFWEIVTWNRGQICSNPKVSMLALGNSRVQYGVDDSQIPGLWNVGLNADNFNVIYWKLRLLHKYNPQLKKVFVEVDQANTFSYFSNVEYKLHPFYFDVISLDDLLWLLKYDRRIMMNPFDWEKVLYPLLSHISYVDFKEYGLGGYTNLDRFKLQEGLVNEKNCESHTINEIQSYYLKSIVDYCEQNNLEVIFFNMPSFVSKSVRMGNRILKEHISSEYPHVKYHDLELLELPDSCYGDVWHLNYIGAERCSSVIKHWMR